LIDKLLNLEYEISRQSTFDRGRRGIKVPKGCTIPKATRIKMEERDEIEEDKVLDD
jgi:hypothetical protein